MFTCYFFTVPWIIPKVPTSYTTEYPAWAKGPHSYSQIHCCLYTCSDNEIETTLIDNFKKNSDKRKFYCIFER